MKDEVRCVVIGSGVSGLCATHYLSEKFGRDSVLCLEASDYVGGQTRTDRVDGFICDWGPNGFLDKEPLTLKWIDDIGLSEHLMRCDEAAAHRFILKNDKLIEVFAPPKFLLTSLLSIKGRLRLCCEPFIKAKRDDLPESIWNFAARRIGREAADMMVMPMVSGIFGGDAKQLSLEHCFPVMEKMEREYGGLVKALIGKTRKKEKVSPTGPRGKLTSFKSGIGFLAENAAEMMSERIRNNTEVTRVSHHGFAWCIETRSGDVIETPNVLFAVPAHAAAKMLSRFDDALANVLSSIAYADMAVICTGYRREKVAHDLNGFGFLSPPNQGKRVLGCLWSSSIFPGRAPEGYVQLRSMYGGYNDPDVVKLIDNELIEYLKKEVHPLLGISDEPDFVRIYRHSPAIAQYLLHHRESLKAIEAAEQQYTGLAFAGNSYRGVSLNDCVVSAHRAVDMMR